MVVHISLIHVLVYDLSNRSTVLCLLLLCLQVVSRDRLSRVARPASRTQSVARETSSQDLQHDDQQYRVITVPEVLPNTLLSRLAIRSTHSEGISHSSRKRP